MERISYNDLEKEEQTKLFKIEVQRQLSVFFILGGGDKFAQQYHCLLEKDCSEESIPHVLFYCNQEFAQCIGRAALKELKKKQYLALYNDDHNLEVIFRHGEF